MINLNSLTKIGDVLNSEGAILALYEDQEKKFYLGSFLNDGSGTVYYAVDLYYFKSYLKSEITLKQLYLKSSSFLVKFKFRKTEKTYLKEDFTDLLQCGKDFYKNIPASMKSYQIEKDFT
ncbi:MAG TPA: hypothetical protein DDX98_10205 [Bacteroidales bacterium]|jgi:hypothetical protein|nr:hypothetical protein [Bacteroidales bacterium]